MRLLLSTISVFGLVTFLALPSQAKGKRDSQVEAEPPEAATANNACGCYRDKDDKCHCIKVSKAKCECEGDCEPPECVAKRQHDEAKAAELALKKIKERDKKAQEEAKKAKAKQDKEKAAEKSKREKEKAKESWRE